VRHVGPPQESVESVHDCGGHLVGDESWVFAKHAARPPVHLWPGIRIRDDGGTGK
jgi:hypothetical protein